MGKLFDKDDPIGTQAFRTTKNGRDITFEKVKPYGKNNNLTVKIVSNKKAY